LSPVRRRTALAALLLAIAGAVVAVVVWSHDDEEPAAPPPRAAERGAPAFAPLRSRPDLRPPDVAIDVAPATADDRLIFLSPRMEKPPRDRATHEQGALVVQQDGAVRWFGRARDGEPMLGLRVQRYRGRPVLTWWEGAASKLGIGRGEGVVADGSYRRLATIQAGNGLTADLHEIRLTPQGTALLTIYARTRRDLSAMGGRPNALVTQGIVQEVDVRSGRVLFQWESIDEIAPAESRKPAPKKASESFDYFHINSVEKDRDGDYLVSARHTSAIYKIDRRSGDLVWRLGGERSDFRMGPGTRFGFQHDVQPLSGDDLQLFDNGEKRTVSNVKVLRLDTRRMRATLRRRLPQPDGMWSESQGNAQPLPDGGVMTGWGSAGAFTWFDARGRVVLDGHLPAEYDSYRAYLDRWVGRPRTRPAIAVRREEDQVTVWASWNGSTEVQAWQVLAGPSPDRLRPVGRPAEWTDLETAIVRQTEAPAVAVAALDASGRRLSRSRVVRAPGG
jgi:hypothetical protein